MKTIDEQIEAMADRLSKASIDPKDQLFDVIKSLGSEGLKARLANLNDDEKLVLKAALEEMKLKKAISFDKEAQGAKVIQGNINDTILQEEIASDDADEKLVKPEAAKMDHQGTPTEGWQGQVIKGETKEEIVNKSHAELVAEINKSDEMMDEVVSKMMEKCNDETTVMTKCMGKGMDEKKVQGAIEKYKKGKVKKSEDLEKGKMKEAREDAKEKIMGMEEKEHGTKDPKKLVEAEKKENKMKKSVAWDDETRLLKANILGRNFHFDAGDFLEKSATEVVGTEEVIKKSGELDVNDMIEKSMDRNWIQVNNEKSIEASTKAQNGTLVKSFRDNELAEILGLTEEEAKKILG